MGPRPRGRGIVVRITLLLIFVNGFNGAAPARARNQHGEGPLEFCQARFNGGAPPRARNPSGSPAPSRPAPSLQWGRARAGAESLILPAPPPPATAALQWGRARAGAESDPALVAATKMLGLQWGRAR